MTQGLALIAYGVAASAVFVMLPWVRRSKAAHAAYVVGFLLLSFWYWSGFTVPSSGGMAAGLDVAIGLLGFALCCAANALAWACIAGEYFVRVGRALTGLSQIARIKTYDKAEGAESRRNFVRAAALYREKIDEDTGDFEARRRLAEVLLKMKRSEEAVEQFREALELAEEDEDRCRIAFRLAEVLHETLGRIEEGAALYRTIITDFPGSQHAAFAKSRLRHMGLHHE